MRYASWEGPSEEDHEWQCHTCRGDQTSGHLDRCGERCFRCGTELLWLDSTLKHNDGLSILDPLSPEWWAADYSVVAFCEHCNEEEIVPVRPSTGNAA